MGYGDSVVILALLVSPDEGVVVRHCSFAGLIWWAEGMMTRLCVVWGSFGGMGQGGDIGIVVIAWWNEWK